MKKYQPKKVLLFFLPLLLISTWIIVIYSVELLSNSSLSFGDFHFGADTEEFSHIQFVGDIMLGRNVEKLSRENSLHYPYTRLDSVPENVFLVGNFEASMPKVHVPAPSGTFAFSVHKDLLPPLRAYGFQSMSLANNHSYDYGQESFTHAVQMLTEADIAVFGDQKNQGSSTIVYATINDQTVALVGMYAVFDRPSDDGITQALARATEKSDVQIVYVHWGAEYELVHNDFQEELAHAFIDAGADAVVGHHPHVVQDIGVYKNKPIFYSLGNFIFDQYFSSDVQEGLSIRLTPQKEALSITIIPVSSLGQRSQPAFMESAEKADFLKKIAQRSEKGLATMIEKGILEFR